MKQHEEAQAVILSVLLFSKNNNSGNILQG